jgi:hypothetical protein
MKLDPAKAPPHQAAWSSEVADMSRVQGPKHCRGGRSRQEQLAGIHSPPTFHARTHAQVRTAPVVLARVAFRLRPVREQTQPNHTIPGPRVKYRIQISFEITALCRCMDLPGGDEMQRVGPAGRRQAASPGRDMNVAHEFRIRLPNK